MKQIYIPKQDYKVLVRCNTYNQSKFIVDALNGFAIQNTNFPFVCLVVEDCSIDGEQEVIKSWVEYECDMKKAEYIDLELSSVIFVPHKKNANCHFAIYLLKHNLYGNPRKNELFRPWSRHSNYLAFCEGDDYWVVDNKLQKQVDALDNNPHSTMVYTDYQTVDEIGNTIARPKYEKYKKLHMSGDNLPNLYKTNYPLTCTVMVRKEVLNSNLFVQAPNKLDYSLFLAAAFMGDFVYIDDETSNYRMNPDSLMNNKHNIVTEFAKKVYEYYSYAYAQGLSKKECFINDFFIKYHISKMYVSHVQEHKSTFKKLCEYNKCFYLFVPIVWLVKIFEKMTFQR